VAGVVGVTIIGVFPEQIRKDRKDLQDRVAEAIPIGSSRSAAKDWLETEDVSWVGEIIND
jgi:hypothetical protein